LNAAGPILTPYLLRDILLTRGPVAVALKGLPWRPIVISGRAYSKH
jgi:hypothetical protein